MNLSALSLGRGPLLLLVLTPALAACAGTAGMALHVRPAQPGPSDAVEAQHRVAGAVREVAEVGGLSCESTPSELLSCWPDSRVLGSSPAFVSFHLRSEPEGFLVTVLESFRGFSGPRYLCAIQDRLVDRIDARGGGTVERDPRVSCPKKTASAGH